ncbi:MAG TPA: DUF4864 domain-containing protein [Methylomirabilota bacterium]|nr:DUF4864 domain-containing protein [Methylomirabilota bacterium]
MSDAPDRRSAARGAAAALLALALLALAGPASPQDRAMVDAVLQQLAAFRRGDWAGAYAFASSAIQAQFGLDAFREMVTRGYAPIARSARATVRRVERLGPHRGLVAVRVDGQDGDAIEALYEMVDEGGAWRVNGVAARPVDPGVPARGTPGPGPEPDRAARVGGRSGAPPPES